MKPLHDLQWQPTGIPADTTPSCRMDNELITTSSLLSHVQAVQCHIKPQGQDKAIGLSQVLRQYFPEVQSKQVITVGDSPNDESLFDPSYFPYSVGVANIQHYLDRLTHRPAYMTQASEVAGFCELTEHLLNPP